MATEQTKTARLDARLPQKVLDVIKTAAELQGRSLTDFVVGAAREAAERTIEQHSVVRLSAEDQVKFAKALLRPQSPLRAMHKAAKTHGKLIDSDLER